MKLVTTYHTSHGKRKPKGVHRYSKTGTKQFAIDEKKEDAFKKERRFLVAY
jgi:hypothetical protein